jgi:hypothetical protein
MKKELLKLLICFAFFASVFPLKNANSQTAGTLSFNVNPVTKNGSWGADHFIAIWLENSTTAFVKTKLKLADSHGTNSHLLVWKAKSASNVVDATTGASLTSYAPINIIWNGTDIIGSIPYNLVPDGTYTVWVEFTWNHNASGTATTSLSFTKGPAIVSQTQTANTNFSGVSLTWTPAAQITLTTSTLSITNYCAGTAVSVPFTKGAGTIYNNNVWTAQLSDASGSFASPVSIGTLAGTTVGTIAATIPAGTPAGTGYRIRVIGSQPSTIGTDNGTNITINAVVTPSVSIGASATTICSGSSVTFTPTPVNGGTPSYQWKVNGVNTTTGSTYTTTSLNNSDIVSCVMTTNVPCPSSTTATSNGITMIVNPSVIPSVSIGASATSICVGTSVTFTVTPTNGGTTPSYQWKLNGANIATGSTYTTTTLNNGDQVTCVMTSAALCASTPTVTSNSISITVSGSVTPSVTIGASSTTICNGASVTFTPTPVNGGAPTYQWKLNGVNIATGPSYVTSTLNNNDQVTCDMTSSLACATNTTVSSNIIAMVVNVTATPIVDVTNNCDNSILNATATGTLLWSTGETTSSITVAVAGTYTVTQTLLGCESASASGIASPNFPAAVTISENLGILTSTATSGNQWYEVSSGIIVGATNQSYSPAINGLYFSVVTDLNGCVINSDTINFVAISVESNSFSEMIKVYPNPTSGTIIIDFNKLVNSGKIEITNTLGMVIYEEKFDQYPAVFRSIDLSKYSNGIYFVDVQLINNQLRYKLILNK